MRALMTLLIIFLTALFTLGAVEESSADPKLKQAQELITKREYDKAITLLKTIVASHQNPEAFNYLGYSYRQLGNMNRAIKHYQSSLEINPSQKGANEYLGEVYLMNGELSKAEERLLFLERLCSTDCIEYKALKDKINYFKKIIYRIEDKMIN